MCSDTLQSETTALQRTGGKAVLRGDIGMKRNGTQKDLKIQGSPTATV